MLEGQLSSPVTAPILGTQLRKCYDTYFSAQEACTTELLKTALALRYQVYCVERKFEEPTRYADRLERDELDRHSAHGLLLYRPRSEAIGTVRLILPHADTTGFPIHCLLRQLDIDASYYFPCRATAEVSRFAISREFRRRVADNLPNPLAGGLQPSGNAESRSNLPCLGLVQIMLRMSIARGITHWAGVMEPQLLRMLCALGIHFTAIGPRVSYHGIRQPAFCHVPEMLERFSCEKPEYWDVVTNAGALSYGR
jgi:N-acyl amino acid synthase of PEP-CTERM/exosortase system